MSEGMTEAPPHAPLVRVTRGDATDSVHYGSVAVVDADISVSDRGQPLDAQHWKRSVQLQVVACQPRAEGDFARPIDDHDDGGDRRCDE